MDLNRGPVTRIDLSMDGWTHQKEWHEEVAADWE